jgi:hypothetical protein
VAEAVEASVRTELRYVTVLTHVGPAEDPRSLADQGLDRDPDTDSGLT